MQRDRIELSEELDIPRDMGLLDKSNVGELIKILSSENNFEFTTIDKGIKSTVEWFISNYNNCKQWCDKRNRENRSSSNSKD